MKILFAFFFLAIYLLGVATGMMWEAYISCRSERKQAEEFLKQVEEDLKHPLGLTPTPKLAVAEVLIRLKDLPRWQPRSIVDDEMIRRIADDEETSTNSR